MARNENTTAQDDAMLDGLFAAAKSDADIQPSADLMARVLADAEATQAAMAQPAPIAAAKPSVFKQFIAKLGGWQSLSGLAMATVAGLWIGVAAGPAMMQSDFGTSLIVTSDETYLSALDASFAYFGN